MLRDYISLTLGVLTLLIASGAVYGILTINTQIQAKPETTIPDYSSELASLKSQINSMNSQIGSMSSSLSSMNGNLSTLDSVKNGLIDVNAKLIELEKNTNQASPSVQTANSQLSVLLDKPVYLQGDTIKIAAIGATPQKIVQVELIDSSGYIITNGQTYADSAGKVSYNIQIPSSQISGNYQVKLVSDQQISSTPIIIQSSTSSTSNTSTFTAQTDKTTYYTNDLVQVTGTAQPNTAVTAVFTSASGYTATSSTTANGDGSYTLIFDILSSYQTGTWTITLTNVAQTKSLSIYIQSGSSNTFTAQTSKSTYNSGDTIQISGTGQPNTAVTGVLTSPTGRTYNSGSTVSTGGSYTVYFSSLQYYETGTWSVTMNNAGQSKTITFYMQSTSSTTFTAQTTQSTYSRGAVIEVTGTGQPNTIVNEVLTSPSGGTYSASSTIQSDGTYAIFFQTSASYQAGTWTISVSNSSQSKTLYVMLQ
ncbi:MAG TPA: hypothetical protein VEU72_01535 [Nitrosopumilaceae archaeon]|nr:hypothetical protein [Nitrosopumilaceae archaeon]